MFQGTTRRRLLTVTGSAAATALAGCFGGMRGNEPSSPNTTPAAGEFDGVVDAQWLADHRDDVALLDVRDEDAFEDARIAGAHRLTDTIHDHYEETDGSPETSLDETGAVLESAGVAEDDDVVVYGDGMTMWVTHGAYTLEAIGHEGEVAVLDGGFPAWADADEEAASGSIDEEPEPTEYEAELATDVLATRADVAERVHEDGADAQLVDNREPAEYHGLDDDDDRFDRHGHITGAINVNFSQNFVDDSSRFRSPEDLEDLWLEHADLDRDEETISYCTTGVRGSVGWFVMEQLGWDDVRVYDGSWVDWGTLSEVDGYYYTSGEEMGTVVDPFA